MSQPGPHRLIGVEIARGIAASCVVLYHCARHLNADHATPWLMSFWQFGHAGVDLFFVISGFIITYVHHDDIGSPHRLGRYIARRFQRIYPLYWIATAATLFLELAAGHGLPSISHVLNSLSLQPFAGEPILGVAWTLQYEVTFYIVFGLAIWNRNLGFVLGVIWLALIGTVAVAGPLPFVPPLLTSAFSLQFLFGVLAAVWLRRSPATIPPWLWHAGLAGVAIAAFAEDMGWMNGYAEPARLAYGIPSGLIILGAALRSARANTKATPLLTALGSASYSIYLFQFVFIGIAWQAWTHIVPKGLAPDWAAFVVLGIAGIVGGCVVSRTCEYPLLGWIRTHMNADRRRPGMPVA